MWISKYRRLMEEAGDDGAAGGGGAPDAGAPAGDVSGGGAPAGDVSGDGAPDAGATGDIGGGSSNSAPSDFFATAPEDWRNQMLARAGFDLESDEGKKALNQLSRVSDFGTLAKNYLNAQEKIRSGEMSNGLPENPSDEQVAEWREANGIPATADDYQLQLDEGLVLGEADERVMGDIYKIAHDANIPAEAMNAMTNAMLKGRQAEADARMAQDGVDKQTSDRQLKEAWAGDFDTNLNMVKGLVNSLPETVRDAFASARMPDGRAVFNSPEVMVAMADWARTINPSATVVPNSSNPMQSINDEIATLEARMGTDEWYKDQAAQERYRSLIEVRDKMSAA